MSKPIWARDDGGVDLARASVVPVDVVLRVHTTNGSITRGITRAEALELATAIQVHYADQVDPEPILRRAEKAAAERDARAWAAGYGQGREDEAAGADIDPRAVVTGE